MNVFTAMEVNRMTWLGLALRPVRGRDRRLENVGVVGDDFELGGYDMVLSVHRNHNC